MPIHNKGDERWGVPLKKGGDGVEGSRGGRRGKMKQVRKAIGL